HSQRHWHRPLGSFPIDIHSSRRATKGQISDRFALKGSRLNLHQVAAAGFLLVLAGAPLAAVIAALTRSRLSPVQCFLWSIGYLLSKFLWRAQWPQPLTLPDDQGAVIVCNHRSSVDPFFVQTATGRKVHWMVARE